MFVEPRRFAVFFPKVLVTEEIAWRGFALPRPRAGRSALSASIILGLLWEVWHTPH
ncbi:MAG: CPBP family intramembrane glutamic endopeptidase [Chloroflexota bacterium]